MDTLRRKRTHLSQLAQSHSAKLRLKIMRSPHQTVKIQTTISKFGMLKTDPRDHAWPLCLRFLVMWSVEAPVSRVEDKESQSGRLVRTFRGRSERALFTMAGVEEVYESRTGRLASWW